MLAGYQYIAVIDVTSFFYQWRVHPDYRYMLTVVSHRGQKTFNVLIMKCMNSIAYVQRQIDYILRRLKDAKAKAYVDDVVTETFTFQKHLSDLRELFTLFREYNISISPSKAFLDYPNVNLLEQKVNSLGLATSEEKLKAISRLQYPKTLGDLKHYLGFIGYLRQYVHFYAQLERPLKNLKTRILKGAPFQRNPRKAYALRTKLPPTSLMKEVSFQELQKALFKSSLLIHFSLTRIL